MKPAAFVAGALLLFFAAAAADLGLRSRQALAEAKRHEAWAAAPALKKKHFEALHAGAVSRLERDAAAGSLSAEQSKAARAALDAELEFNLSESSAKQAYAWYRTAAREFRSPLNPWAAEAEARLPAAREAWRAELAAKGIKAEDWRLD